MTTENDKTIKKGNGGRGTLLQNRYRCKKLDAASHARQEVGAMNTRPPDTRFQVRACAHTNNRTQVVDSRKGPAVLVTDSLPVFGCLHFGGTHDEHLSTDGHAATR